MSWILEWLRGLPKDSVYLEVLRDFDPFEYEADILLSRNFDELNNQEELEKKVKFLLDQKINQLVRLILKEKRENESR